jgi:PAS domain S-box-containing protein
MMESEFPRRWWLNSAAGYAAAVSSVAIAIIAAEVITRLLNAEAIASSMLCAVIFAAWVGGFGPALLAVALALLAFHYYLAPPVASFIWKDDLLAVGISEVSRLVLFSLTSLIVAFVISAQRKAAQELRRSGDDLHVAMEGQERIQAALQRSEMYLNEAQLLSGTGSFGWNVASGEIIWSDQTFRILGVDRTTKPTLEFIVERTHPEDRAAVRDIIDRATREGKNFDHEHRLLIPDGSVKYVHVVARAQKDTSGSLEFVGAVMDVTAVKRAERKLRRSESYLAEAQRLSHTCSWAWDVRRREFVYRSPETYRLFGVDPNEDTGSPHPFYDRIHPEDRERIGEMARRAVREKADLELDFRIGFPDGSIRYVHSVGHPFLGEDGEVVQLVGTHIDVTEQHLASRKLQEAFDEIKKSEDRLRLVIDTIPTLVWRAGSDGVPDFLNQRALDYIGLSPEQVDIAWPRAFHRDDRKGMVEKWGAIRESGMRGEFEARLRRFDGEYRWFVFEAEPLRDESGNIVKWYGSSTDIEDRKQSENALRRSEAYSAQAQRLTRTGTFAWRVATGENTWSTETFRIFGYDDASAANIDMVIARTHPEDRAAVREAIDRASVDGSDYAWRVATGENSWSTGAFRVFGYDDASAANVDMVIARTHPEDRAAVKEAIDRASVDANDYDQEYRLLMPDGSVKYVHAVARAERDASGHVEFVGAVMDVTATKETERKLRRSEAYLAEAQRLSHTSSWAWDVRRRDFVYLSPELYRLFGLDPKKDFQSPQPFRDRIVPEDRERVIEIGRRIVREKTDLEVEFRVALPDGSIRYVRTLGRPVLGRDGEVAELICTHIDMTEQRLASQRLQEAFEEIKRSEDRLRLVVDTIPALVWRASPEGIPDFLNQPALDYTGLASDQIEIGWPRAFHPEDKKGMLVKWSGIRQSGMPGELEARLRRFDGEYRWFLFRGVPLRDESGKIVKWYGSSTDIEDRKRAEEKLRRSEAELIEAQRVSQTGSFVWNVPTGERIGSQEFFRILGFDDPRSVTFEMVLQRAHPEDRAQVEQTIENTVSAGKDLDYEHRLLMPDGSVKFVHVVAHAGTNQAGQLEYIGAVVDVTAATQAEEKLQKAQTELARVTRVMTLGEMTASISHEVNQPLAAVVNAAGACLRWLGGSTPNLDEARRAAEWIIKEGNRAAEVIRRVRSLAKNVEPQKEPLDINGIVDEVMALVQRELATRQVRWRLELAPALPTVFADRVQLQQVIINLVMNGVEAMQPIADRPHELLIRSYQDEGGRAAVDVVDSGVGISADSADRLFNAFFTTKSGGMGIGLSICRSIIEAHGGRLSAANNPGPGARFQFTLPMYQEEAA